MDPERLNKLDVILQPIWVTFLVVLKELRDKNKMKYLKTVI